MIRENSPRSLNHMATNFLKKFWFRACHRMRYDSTTALRQRVPTWWWAYTGHSSDHGSRLSRWRSRQLEHGAHELRCQNVDENGDDADDEEHRFACPQLQSSHFSELIHPQISYLFTDYSISSDKSPFSCAHPKRLLISHFLPPPDIDTATRFINDRNQKIIITNQSVLLGMTFHLENEIIHANYYR